MATPSPETETHTGASAAVDSDEDAVWYTFFNEREKREYYYNPQTEKSTWILPNGARRHVSKEGKFVTANDEAVRSLDFGEEEEEDAHSAIVLRASFVAKVLLWMFILNLVFSFVMPSTDTKVLPEVAKEAKRPASSPTAQVKKTVVPTEELKKAAKVEAQKKKEVKKKETAKEKKERLAKETERLEHHSNMTSVLAIEQLTENIESAIKSGEILMKKIMDDAWSAGMAIRSTPSEEVEVEKVIPCKAPFSYVFKKECRNRKGATFDAENFAESLVME